MKTLILFCTILTLSLTSCTPEDITPSATDKKIDIIWDTNGENGHLDYEVYNYILDFIDYDYILKNTTTKNILTLYMHKGQSASFLVKNSSPASPDIYNHMIIIVDGIETMNDTINGDLASTITVYEDKQQ